MRKLLVTWIILSFPKVLQCFAMHASICLVRVRRRPPHGMGGVGGACFVIQLCRNCVLTVCQLCAGCVWTVSQLCVNCVWTVSQLCVRRVWTVSHIVFELRPKFFSYAPSVFQWRFNCVFKCVRNMSEPCRDITRTMSWTALGLCLNCAASLSPFCPKCVSIAFELCPNSVTIVAQLSCQLCHNKVWTMS